MRPELLGNFSPTSLVWSFLQSNTGLPNDSQDGTTLMAMLQVIRFGLRTLFHNELLAVVTVPTLAMGIELPPPFSAC